MSTEQELKELMGLVGALAQDTALYMGNVVQINKVQTSAQALEDRLRALLAELDAAREDAARWQAVAFGENLHLGVFYLDHFGERLVFEGQEAVDVVDAVRKVES